MKQKKKDLTSTQMFRFPFIHFLNEKEKSKKPNNLFKYFRFIDKQIFYLTFIYLYLRIFFLN
jgi:hypothetical protein